MVVEEASMERAAREKAEQESLELVQLIRREHAEAVTRLEERTLHSLGRAERNARKISSKLEVRRKRRRRPVGLCWTRILYRWLDRQHRRQGLPPLVQYRGSSTGVHPVELCLHGPPLSGTPADARSVGVW